MSEHSEKDGNTAFHEGDYATALKHYDKAIKRAGSGASAVLFCNKAAALLELEVWDLCVQLCRKALNAPGLTEKLKSQIYHQMCCSFKAQEKWQEALEAYKKFESTEAGFAEDLSKENQGVRKTGTTNSTAEKQALWESFQNRGNRFLITGKYEFAISAYTDAIELKREVAPKEVADLLVRRAAAYLADEKPMDTFWDCQSALFVEAGHRSAILQLAKAHSGLGNYVKAKELLLRSPHTTRSDFQAEISRVNRLLREQQTGDYDFKTMLKEAAASTTPRLDHADYNGGVEVRWISKERGNGLVALRDFVPGDLLFVSKAFEATYRSECKARINLKPGANDATKTECIFRIFQRISKNKDLAQDDPITAIDTRRVAGIVTLNSTGLCDWEKDSVMSGERPGFGELGAGFSFAGYGIWILNSFVNHSCAPNTARFFVGDLLFVRAARRIRKGQELTYSYVSSGTDYNERQKALVTRNYVSCLCKLCVYDSKRILQHPSFDSERKKCDKAFWATCDRFSHDRKIPFSIASEELRKLAENFSARLAYKGRYDRGLRDFYMTLARVYIADGQFLKAAEAFEVAYFAVAGAESSDEIMFSYNSSSRDACYLCFHIAHNLLLGKEIDKAREYLSKMQTAAKILWGSADKDLLEIMYPGLPVEFLFKSLA